MEDFERICERVGNVRDEAVAQGARIVHRTKQVTVAAKTGEKLYNVQSKFKPRILFREEQRLYRSPSLQPMQPHRSECQFLNLQVHHLINLNQKNVHSPP